MKNIVLVILLGLTTSLFAQPKDIRIISIQEANNKHVVTPEQPVPVDKALTVIVEWETGAFTVGSTARSEKYMSKVIKHTKKYLAQSYRVERIYVIKKWAHGIQPVGFYVGGNKYRAELVVVIGG